MNIFILDNDLEKCAEYHVNKHTYKLILENAQMLSTVVRLTGIDTGYKITHQNHPCTKWVNSSLSNWLWLKELSYYLNKEWQYRYNHTNNHKSFDVIESLPIPDIKDIGLTPFAICMNDECKIANDPISSYRNYYNQEKRHLFSWKKREVPYWIKL